MLGRTSPLHRSTGACTPTRGCGGSSCVMVPGHAAHWRPSSGSAKTPTLLGSGYSNSEVVRIGGNSSVSSAPRSSASSRRSTSPRLSLTDAAIAQLQSPRHSQTKSHSSSSLKNHHVTLDDILQDKPYTGSVMSKSAGSTKSHATPEKLHTSSWIDESSSSSSSEDELSPQKEVWEAKDIVTPKRQWYTSPQAPRRHSPGDDFGWLDTDSEGEGNPRRVLYPSASRSAPVPERRRWLPQDRTESKSENRRAVRTLFPRPSTPKDTPAVVPSQERAKSPPKTTSSNALTRSEGRTMRELFKTPPKSTPSPDKSTRSAGRTMRELFKTPSSLDKPTRSEGRTMRDLFKTPADWRDSVAAPRNTARTLFPRRDTEEIPQGTSRWTMSEDDI